MGVARSCCVAAFICCVAASGCGGPGRSPEAAARAFLEASQAGDVDAVWRLVGPRTRARLADDARRAGEQAGRREVSPRELLAVGWTPPRFVATELREQRRAGDTAVVVATGRHDEREEVSLVRERDGWKVELP